MVVYTLESECGMMVSRETIYEKKEVMVRRACSESDSVSIVEVSIARHITGVDVVHVA